MALRDILVLPDPKLRQVSEPVGRMNDELRRLAKDMLDTMYAAPGIGLAAIQIGVPKRLIVLDLAKADEQPQPMVLVDPEIVWSSDELKTYEEGCLSIPEYYGEVERPAKVRVRFRDEQDIEQELDADGLLATCIQHEIDHLDGKLFVDHLSRLKREMVTKKFAKLARRE